LANCMGTDPPFIVKIFTRGVSSVVILHLDCRSGSLGHRN